MSDIKINHLAFDEAAFFSAIKDYFVEVLDDVGEHLLDELATEIILNGVGKMRWREDAARNLHKLNQQITDEMVQIDVGIDLSKVTGEALSARIAVALFGNQLQGPLTTKPGEMVYGDDITDESYHESIASKVWDLPPDWNMEADAELMMENAVKKTERYYSDALSAAVRGIDPSLFYGNVSVVGG